LFLSKHEYKKKNIDILFIPGGTYTGTFRPFVTINQNLLPFESDEIKRYGFGLNYFKFKLLKLLQEITNKNANGLIFLTNYAKETVTKVSNLKAENIIVIPHGVNNKFNLNPTKRIFRSTSEFTKIPCKIIYISSIEVYKHQWNVVEAVEYLYKNGYNINLKLVGSAGSGSKRLRSVLNENNKHYVSYDGAASYNEIEKLYQEADIGIFASSCETFGMILTESMLCSLPIAASKMSAIPDVIGNAGLFFDPLNSKDISDKIKLFYESDSLRTDFAIKGYNHVQKYNWEKSSTETFQYFKLILNKYNLEKHAKK
jgi:glycosyltransferase involved in cell wall biosynthesis